MYIIYVLHMCICNIWYILFSICLLSVSFKPYEIHSSHLDSVPYAAGVRILEASLSVEVRPQPPYVFWEASSRMVSKLDLGQLWDGSDQEGTSQKLHTTGLRGSHWEPNQRGP